MATQTAMKEMNLEPILIKAMDKEEGYGWTKEHALAVEKEYRRFLMLCLENPDIPIVPSSVVDDLWHMHILDTFKYQADCEQFLGFFLHHFPYFGMRGEDDAQNLTNAWEHTKALYEHKFGSLPHELWPNSQRCPNCGKRCKNDDDRTLAMMESRPTFESLGL